MGNEELVVTITVERSVTREMERLREGSYADYICGRDEFDDHRTSHVTAWHGSRPIGMVRITARPPFAMVKWTKGKFVPPGDGQHSAEMTRGIVHSDSRRNGIYKVLMMESMIRTASMNMNIAFAAVEPDFTGKPFLHSLGFSDLGHPLWFDDHVLLQPISSDLTHKDKWHTMFREQVANLRERGVHIRSELL